MMVDDDSSYVAVSGYSSFNLTLYLAVLITIESCWTTMTQ